MKVDNVLFQDIFDKRECHKIFIELESGNPTDKKWYVTLEDEEIMGPLNTFEMDSLFQSYKLTKKSKMKTKD